jgi:D-3-phosphoglycerate dehydrogenase
MLKILLVEKIFEEGIRLLAQHGEVLLSPSTNENVLIKKVRDVDGIVVRTSSLSSKVIRAGQKLKVIGRHGIGFENIDVEAATQKGVVVVYTPMAHIRSVVEHIVGMMLYMCKKLHAADQALREGQFNLTGTLCSRPSPSRGTI